MWDRIKGPIRPLLVVLLATAFTGCAGKPAPQAPSASAPVPATPGAPATPPSPAAASSQPKKEPAAKADESASSGNEKEKESDGGAAKKTSSPEDALDQEGTADPAGSEAESKTATSKTASGPTGAKTAKERQQDAEKKLDGSLQEFDEMLLREQQELAERRQEGAGGPSSTNGSQGTAGGSGASVKGEQGTAGPAGTSAGNPSGEAEAGEQNRSGQGIAAAPKHIPDGSDDDIVARQLREAAAAEKDPALQKKLWVEYCRYKKSAGGAQCRAADAQEPAEGIDEPGSEKP